MFQSVDPKQSFPELEHQMLEAWDKNKTFEKSVEARKDGEKYVFFDGPPFANGLPHYGHILANSLKDAVTRYWTMKGSYVPRTNGWDCHGLPVEYEIEKKLELAGRKDIVDMGVEKFNDACRESVFTYTKEWEQLLRRIGRWVDFGQSYATLNNDYMESIWWVFSQIWKKEMVYQGHKSMHVCPRCETPLSNFEVSQGYKDVTDLSATAKFKLKGEDVFVLAWTTTPWTLPGNIA
ncbi:MAG TPA: class I tRNA ligase family protein, partial [Candidatus Gracilibacteria bacterium]|nr:class I tRNA ligase family protein [Candidatus Gracilibacteria bacterium]